MTWWFVLHTRNFNVYTIIFLINAIFTYHSFCSYKLYKNFDNLRNDSTVHNMQGFQKNKINCCSPLLQNAPQRSCPRYRVMVFQSSWQSTQSSAAVSCEGMHPQYTHTQHLKRTDTMSLWMWNMSSEINL